MVSRDARALWERMMGRREVLRRLRSDQVIICLQCNGRDGAASCCNDTGTMTVSQALLWVDRELEVLLKK